MAEMYSKRVFQLKDLGCFFTQSPLKVTVLMLSLTAMVKDAGIMGTSHRRLISAIHLP